MSKKEDKTKDKCKQRYESEEWSYISYYASFDTHTVESCDTKLTL